MKLICIIIGALLFSGSARAEHPVPFIQYDDPSVRVLFNAYRVVAVLKFCNKMDYLHDGDLKAAERILQIKEIPSKVDSDLKPIKPRVDLDKLFDAAFQSVKGLGIDAEICRAAFLQLLENPGMFDIDERFVITSESK